MSRERNVIAYPEGYSPDTVWKWEPDDAGPWATINRPVSGSTHEKELPTGKHPFQLYSLATPNGVKVTIMFEELLALGKEKAVKLFSKVK